MTPDDLWLRRWLTDTWERVASTFLAALLVWLTSWDGGRLEDGTHWLVALVAACIPPVLVAIMQLLPGLAYTGPVWWIDALVRITRSALQGFIGALLAGATLLSVSTWQAAAIAGGMAAIAAVKSIIATTKRGTISPASLVRDRGAR